MKRKELLEKKLEGLREMRALGDITREEFLTDKRKIEVEQEKLELQIQDLEHTEYDRKSGELDIKEIQKTLYNLIVAVRTYFLDVMAACAAADNARKWREYN